MVRLYYLILLINVAFWCIPQTEYSTSMQVNSADSIPDVKITAPRTGDIVGWNSQVPYSIMVSDVVDGESRYNEINANETLLEVVYIPKMAADSAAIFKKALQQEHPGLAFIKTSTCFGCHADKTSSSGPSFKEIATRYKNNEQHLQQLAGSIIDGSSEKWGSLLMPAHPNFSKEQAILMAKYILQQGSDENRWIYPGFEGVLRIKEKPVDTDEATYVLTASYTSKAKHRGRHSVLINVK